MKKTFIIISSILGGIIVLILLSVLIINIMNYRDCVYVPDFACENTYQGNYAYYNMIDIDSGNFAYLRKGVLSSKLIITDSESNQTEVSDVSSPFKLCEEKVFYKKWGDLYCKNIDGTQKAKIADKVDKFFVSGDKVVYSEGVNLLSLISVDFYTAVFVYDISTEKTELICEDSSNICVKDSRLFILGFPNTVTIISLDDMSAVEYEMATGFGSPTTMMPIGEDVLFELLPCQLGIFNTETHKTKLLKLFEDYNMFHGMTFVCNDENVFFTFSVVSASGSMPYRSKEDKEDERNGVWQVDCETRESRKITDEEFDRLYLFSEDQLFGQKGVDIYKIDIYTGQIENFTK